jgi:glycerol-3-phosphate acyltransferase PlsX
VESNSIIALDAMSGDLGPEVVVHAASVCLEKHSGLRLLLVGDEGILGGMVSRIIGSTSG